MRRFLLVPCALVLGTITTLAADKDQLKKLSPQVAELIKGSAEDFIKRFDKNNDGFLTQDEMPARLAGMFDKIDTNGDGKLDQQEVEKMLQVLRKRYNLEAKAPTTKPKEGAAKELVTAPEVDRFVQRLLDTLDTNKDGKISREEAKGPLAEQFDRLDLNKDGFLDKEELRKAAARLLANKENKKMDKPGGILDAGGPAIPDFDALDRNADGRLTPDELKGTPYADKFEEMDTNKDGKIDKKEFVAYFKKQASVKKTEK